MISHHTKVCVLLSSFTFFWIWQIAQPVLDDHLPWISIGPHTNLTLPVSEVISQYLGVGTLLSGYALYSAVNYGQLSFRMNIAFLLPSFMIANGHGIHVAGVIIQMQMTKQDPLHALVYFLHEHWSHNTFLIGFYGFVFLLIWAEKHGLKRTPNSLKCGKMKGASTDHLEQNLATTPKARLDNNHFNTSHSCLSTAPAVQECIKQLSPLPTINGSVEMVSKATMNNNNYNNGMVNFHNQSNSHSNGILTNTQQWLPTTDRKSLRLQTGGGKLGKNSTVQGRQMSTLSARFIILWTAWVMPLIMGVYFSVFASLTSTKPLTTLFYMGVLSSQMTLYKQLSFNGLSDFLRLWESEMLVGGFFTKAVLIGLPLMLIDFE